MSSNLLHKNIRGNVDKLLNETFGDEFTLGRGGGFLKNTTEEVKRSIR